MSKVTVVEHHLDKAANVYRLVFADESGLQEEIVWAADDPQWKGKSAKSISSSQRTIVSDLLTRRASERERAEGKLASARTDLGGAGTEL